MVECSSAPMRDDNALRRRIVEIITRAGEGHIPSAFSIVDIVAQVYALMGPSDHFVLSKGHGCAALYAVLEAKGVLPASALDAYGAFTGILGGHPDRTKVPGVEASTGSLGHGLPIAAGMALGYKLQGKPDRVICLVGDGECHEGAIWETALVAAGRGLTNLCVIVDRNGSADQILPHPNMAAQWEAFGWAVQQSDGHAAPTGYLTRLFLDYSYSKPLCIIAHTVKGKGVPMLEGHGPWHHKIPNAQEYAEIMEALNG